MENALSAEVSNLLLRSSKKKKRVDDDGDPTSVDTYMKDGSIGCSKSFKDKLLGINSEESEKLYYGFASDDDEFNEVDDDQEFPTIALTKAEKSRLRHRWQQTLIIKVMGRTVGYTYLLNSIKALWKPKSPIDLIALQNDYFLVKFASTDDYNFVKYEGPWMILEHYLIVKEWTPNFDPISDKTEKLLVWIRFPCLPIEYYVIEFLMRVGSKVGRLIRLDQTTRLASRVLFARVCVEIDITTSYCQIYGLKMQ